MKKLLYHTTFLAIVFFAMNSNAQLPGKGLSNGSIAPDFTFTDMNGNTQHLYSYLDAGKAVVIDISRAVS